VLQNYKINNMETNKNKHKALSALRSPHKTRRPCYWRYIYMNLVLSIILVVFSGYSFANFFEEQCNIPNDQLPKTPEIGAVISNCIDEESCMMGLEFEDKVGSFIFSGVAIERKTNPILYIELDTFRVNELVGTRMMGEQSFFDGLRIYYGYSDGNGCSFGTVAEVKYNKKRNEMDVTVVPSIR